MSTSDGANNLSSAWQRLVTAMQVRFRGSAAQAFLGRLGALDFANSIVLFGASLLLSVLPFTILLSSLANRRVDTDLSRHLGLNHQGADIVSELFRSTPTHSAAPIVTALILAVVGTMAVAGSLQVIYERTFGQPHRGWRDVLRYLTWAGVLFGVLVTESILSGPVHAVGGPVAQGLVTYAGTAAFFWWTMHLLLAGRVPWRRLIHAAIVTAFLWIGLELLSAVYFSATIVSDSRLYGTIGVVFSLLTWFIAIGAVIVLGAVGGATWDQRKAPAGSDNPTSGRLLSGLLREVISIACRAMAERIRHAFLFLRDRLDRSGHGGRIGFHGRPGDHRDPSQEPADQPAAPPPCRPGHSPG